MEDDDEFGDLYTDVLSAFPSSSSTTTSSVVAPSTVNSSSQAPTVLPIDLNLQSDVVDDFPNSKFGATRSSQNSKLDVVLENQAPVKDDSVLLNLNLKKVVENSEDSSNLVSDSSGARVLQKTGDLNLGVVNEVKQRGEDVEGGNQLDDDKEEVKFAIEDDLDSEPVIPGINNVSGNVTAFAATAAAPVIDSGGGDWDSDSDSEDDLQIVLNGPMGMEGNGGMVGSDEDDRLVIVTNEDATGGHQAAEERDWGEEGVPAAEGKESADGGAKANAGVASAPKIGYSNYGYHPFHSQFKYVRPGAAPLPGAPAGSGGAPGQVRPPINVSSMAGRGRGDWRPPGMKGPPMQKGFHPGFWGSNAPGRGLEFTLPSHKSIFDVDIDSFEEKPWKYPGVDVSDFFNFGLNEESWKEYCKQLEQLRLESTMQSKIRVYESGRAEQEYDPDMPPELAAAAGHHDASAENVDTTKVDGSTGDLAKGPARLRPPPLPTGRAIQVETGCGERLPSVDTRPQRTRDPDTVVIEIALQGSSDDESAGDDAGAHPNNDSGREDDQVDVVDEDGPRSGDEYFDSYPRGHDVMKEDDSRRRSPVMDSCANVDEDVGDKCSPQRAQSDQNGSRGHASSENVDSADEERWTKDKEHQRSPHMSSGDSALNRRSRYDQKEGSIDSMEGKRSPDSFNAASMEDARDGSMDRKVSAAEDMPADVDARKTKDDTDGVASNHAPKDKHNLHSTKQQKVSSEIEPSTAKEIDEGGDFKASRSSDNSKATGSSRDHQKWREGVDEEVVQNGRSTYMGDVKRNHEGGHDLRRKDRDGRMEVERNYMLPKGREDYYSHRDWDPHAANHFHAKSESSDRRKERDYPEVSWQRRDEELHGRRIRAEDARKHERGEEMLSRRRGGKVREVDRSDKDEYLHSRKVLDNSTWRGYHDKDIGLRYREKDEVSKSRHEILDDHHSKRRKDDEHVRRDHVEKEDILLSHRDSSSTRRKRERDGSLSQWKREDQPRIRDNMDDHHSVRLKDDIWVQRERAEQQRDRDDWYRNKQSYEEMLSRREREDGRAPIRSSRNLEEKTWVGHSRGGEEYKGHDKDIGRHGDQMKRRERVEEEPSLQHRGVDDVYARGNQFANEGKRSRQERSSARNHRVVDTSESQRLYEKKHKENVRKVRESDGHSVSGHSKRHQGDKGIANDMADVKGLSEQAMAENDTSLHTREGKGDVSSDDEQHNSKRGRSKLERWTSHKDRDYDAYSKSSSLKIKEFSKDKNIGAGSAGVFDESTKKVEAGNGNQPLAGGKEGGASEGKDGDERPIDGRHIDTVEKLKRRSERFKLPLTSEKDPQVIKKMENEPLPSSQSDTPTNAEVKPERPPRKRRWINS